MRVRFPAKEPCRCGNVPGEVQEHVVVAWSPDNRPFLVENRGTFRTPQVGYCP
jgi:hypothetical protein